MNEKKPPLPEDFKAELLVQFGTEFGNDLIRSLDTDPSVSLRINSKKPESFADSEKLPYEDMEPVEWASGGYRMKERPRFTNHPWLHAGGFYVQEAASMWISELMRRINEEEGTALRVLDLCAAPGGKSIGVIEELPEGSVIVSNEVMPARAVVLKENITKWGYPGSIVTSGPAEAFGLMENTFDLIVVDAPCSGEGMMRKEEVARTQWSRRLIEQCSNLQRSILEDVLPALRPGGWLIYSTCTFNRQENEENVEWLIKGKGLELASDPRRFTPLTDGTEGLFMVLLRKPVIDTEESIIGQNFQGVIGKTGRKARKEKGKVGIDKAYQTGVGELSRWLKEGDWNICDRNGRITAIPGSVSQLMDNFPKGIKVMKAGVELGELKGKDIVPSHDLALSTALNLNEVKKVEVDLPTAQAYLQKEAIRLPEDTPKGPVLLIYKSLPIGWVKNLGNRSNNLYPKEWKIRVLR